MSWIREPDEEPIPGYRLIKPVGSGGFGEVWLCEAPGKILKAIKFVFGNLDASASGDGRARQEFHALQRVKEVRHPFVLSIERIDILEGEVAIVMELAEKSLYDVLQEMRAAGLPGIPRDRLLKYMADAADGLDYLSETHNLMHMDVKPRNLFLVGDHIKVADFGLAKHLERSSSAGILAAISPQYAAPETFTSRITKHSDQYSLAIVYMELLTGKRPFTGKTIRELALLHMNADPDLSGLPERDRRVVGRALAKDPFKRFPNCKAFIEAFGTKSADPPLLPASPPAPHTPPTRKPGAKADHLEFDSVPKTQHFPEAELSARQKEPPTTPTVQAALPFATVIPEPPAAVSIEDNEGVNFDFPEAEGGVLRPTLIVGLGGFGLLALRELRSRLTDRMGDLRQVPSIRFVYLDADPEAKAVGVAGAPDRALLSEQVFQTPLLPVTRYRRAALDLLTEWLPREKLHAIPRTLHPQGSRALGRLAFTENYLRFTTRVRRELEIATHPESLTRSADQSGLATRDSRPRVIVVGAAGGASSGALPDIGYAVTKLLGQLKLQPHVTAFLYLGAPADPTTPAEEAANVYATLTELNHYADESITFRSRYGGPDGPQLESPNRPFSTVYLVQRGGRGPSAAAECAERLAAYLCLDLTTPLGAEFDRARQESATVFRSFGTGGVWFPRGLLLRSASRHVCERLILQWQSSASAVPPGVEAMCKKALADPALRPERVVAQIEEAMRSVDADPREVIRGFLSDVESKAYSADATFGAWATDAYDAVMNLVGVKGSRDPADAVRTGKLTKLFNSAANGIADRWIKSLGGEAIGLLEQPGKRIAATEVGLARLLEFCHRMEEEAVFRAAEYTRRSELAWGHARAAADACGQSGGFSLFGGKDYKHMRALMSALSHYATCRADEEGHIGVVRFFRKLKAGLQDRERDLGICRQRLTHLRRALEIPETAGASIVGGPSPTVELLLPDGSEDIEWAAKKFVETVKPDSLEKLDRALQALVLDPRGGLFGACQKSGDFINELADPMIDQTSAFLGTLLPVTDVAQFTSHRGKDWEQRLRRGFERASPTVAGLAENE